MIASTIWMAARWAGGSLVWPLFRALWARVSPFLMPLVGKVLPWLPPAGGAFLYVFRAFAPVIVVAIGVSVLWWAFSSVWARPAPEDKVAVARVQAQRAEAEATALRNAVDDLQTNLVLRESEKMTITAELSRVMAELEAIRAQSETHDPNGSREPVFAADDPWLRAKSGKGGSGPNRR